MSNATPGTAGIAPSASGKSSANCAMVLLVAAAGSSLDQRVREGAGCYGPELRITGAAAQTRMVSVARIRLVSRKSTRLFKGIICDDISEIAVGTLITERPPHRTERAPFGHSAPTSGT